MSEFCEFGEGEEVDLASVAHRVGWETALYNLSKSNLARGKQRLEDRRSADWLNYLPLQQDDAALVLGCGFGTVPATLAEHCGRVVTIDRERDRLAFLGARRVQQGLRLHPVLGDSQLPFKPGAFDLISIAVSWWRGGEGSGFGETVRQVTPLLKGGGRLQLNLQNRWSPMRLAQPKADGNPQPLSAAGYTRELRSEGFCDIDIYAVLPTFDGIPLFFVPLYDNRAMAYFLRHIFPLFLMVTPEVKKAYGMQLFIALHGVRLALALRLTAFARYFVPGFCIFARWP